MVRIGPAGYDGLGYQGALQKVARMKLDCLEVAFTYGVRATVEAAKEIGTLAKEKGILLSVHAPYYINLASDEKEKAHASIQRIVDACERAAAMEAKKVVFHAGFYQNRSAEETYHRIEQSVQKIQNLIRHKKWKVELCPEITGKSSQFGSLAELLRLRKETGCGITVDFAHLHARCQGQMDYPELFKKLPKWFHAHFSGIQYGDKGEKKHVCTTRKSFEPLAKELMRRKLNVTLINESPRPYEDAAMMKRMLLRFQGIRNKQSAR
jgi:deoxyribonuclease-4